MISENPIDNELVWAIDNLELLIEEQTDGITHMRGEALYRQYAVTIKAFTDNPAFEIKSESKRDKVYQTGFKNLLGEVDEASAYCNCPFAGNHMVCKHMVAAYLAYRDRIWQKVRSGDTRLATKPIDSLQEMEQIHPIQLRQLASDENAFYKGEEHWEEEKAHIKLKQVKAGHIELYIIPPTQSSTSKVTLTKNKKGPTVTCQCGQASNKKLCWHAIAALFYIRENFTPDFFYLDAGTFRSIQETKDELIQPYGFSLANDLTGLFEFSVSNEKVKLNVIDPSLLPLSDYLNWQDYTKSLMPPKAMPETLLNQQKASEQFGVGFGLFFPKIDHKRNPSTTKRLAYLPDFTIIPLKGKLKKKKHAFSGQIQQIGMEELISSLPDLTTEQMGQVQALTNLNFDGTLRIISQYGESRNNLDKRSLIPAKELTEDHLDRVFDAIRGKLLHAIPFLAGQYTVLTDNYEKINTRSIDAITISEEPAGVFFRVIEDEQFIKVLFGIDLGKERILLKDSEPLQVEFISFWWVLSGEILYPIASLEAMKAIYKFENQPEIKVNKSDYSGFFKNFVEPLAQKFPIEMDLDKEIHEVNIDNPELKVYLKELDNFLIFQPAVDYDGTEAELDGGDAFWQYSADKVYRINRNKEQEQYLLETIRALHPQFKKQLNKEYFYLSAEEIMKNHWFLDAFQSLRDHGITIYGQEQLKNLKFNTHKPSVSMNVKSGIDWFDVDVEVAFGDQIVRPKDVRKALQKGNNYVQLDDGTYGILPDDWLQKYENLFRHGNVKKDKVEFPKTHFNLLDDLHEEIDNTAVVEEIEEKKRKLHNFRELEQKPIPETIQAELRDYQKEGFYWLNFLDEFQWGGCLADDMGLGKTIQVLTFLQHQKEQGQTKPSLIVVPTTLVFNWENEIQKFAPDLHYFINWGSSRLQSQEGFNEYDLIIASYDILKNDIELFSGFHFHYVILDEAQAIKNPKSQRYKAVTLLKADNRLTLTGTPLENNTFDLYSQMSFLNPGFLGSQEHFKSEFATPIDKNNDPDKTQKLRKLIYPFILRRKKEEVEKELPEKTVDVLYCEMDPMQKKVYDAFKNDFRDKILQKVDEEGINNSQFYILQGLLKLRQICDSPALLNDEEDYGHEATKLNEIKRHVTEKTGQHKLLIFSQFVGMLKMIRDELKHSEIDFEYLDGQTQKRQEKVDRFQNDENCRVFLVSLKAGGTGLNLTEADYVYIVDPWWNPAVEEQAIDRTHRIGQTKHIFGYKMICRDTIEEKVIQLQDKKSQLADEVVGSEQGFVKNLSRDDLAELFS